MSLLDELNEEIDEDQSTSYPQEESQALELAGEDLLGELNEISKEEALFDELSEKEVQENNKKEQVDQQTDDIAKELNFDEEDDIDPSEFLSTVDEVELVETLAEKKQKEKDLMLELQELKQKKIEELIETKIKIKKTRYTTAQVEALKIQLQDIAASPLITAYIRKGTKLIAISDNKQYKINEGVTVKAHALTDATNFRYIVDLQGIIKYKVYFSKISNIKRVTTMYQAPHHFSRIKKVKKVSNFDKNFDYSIKFNLHGGLTFTQYTNNIVGSTENYAPMVRSELGVMTNMKYPVKIGMSGMYESISGSMKEGGKFSAKTLSFGPTIIKEHFYEEYALVMQPRISLFSNLATTGTNDDQNFKLSDTSLLVGIEKYTNYKMFGKLTLGYNVQRKWIKPKAQTTGFDIDTNVRYDDSFAIYIGHRSDWIW